MNLNWQFELGWWGSEEWVEEKTCLCLWEAEPWKWTEVHRLEKDGKVQAKPFSTDQVKNEKNWDWWKFNWSFVLGNLESTPGNCPEKCMETTLVDDDGEMDNSFKPSTLRRSFRRMRKAVKWDIMKWIFAGVFNMILRSVSSPLMAHKAGLGITKAQSMSALPGGLMSRVNDLRVTPSNAASPYR